MEQVYAGRLLRLADFLDALPPTRFKFDTWVGGDWGGLPDLSCGTTACGLGWATTMPEFQKLGLYLSDGGYQSKLGRSAISPRLRSDGKEPLPPWEATLLATNVIFGLSDDETDFLFTPTEDGRDDPADVDELMPFDELGNDGKLSQRATPSMLAARIRAFVEEKNKT